MAPPPEQGPLAACALNAPPPPASPPASPLPVLHLTYDGIHQQISDSVEGPRQIFSAWQPTLLLCISGGGMIPTRILRSCLRRAQQRQAEAAGRDPASVPNVPVQCVGLQLYDTEGLDPETSAPVRTQWIRHDPQEAARRALRDWEEAQAGGGGAAGATDPAAAAARPLVLQGQRVLVVDEVDDSRATLAACCAELEADAARERDAYEALAAAYTSDENGAGRPPPFAPMELGVFVVYNKRRPKRGVLSDEIIMSGRYFAASYVPNAWIRFPWDAEDIAEHGERAARQQAAMRVLPAAAAANGNGGGSGAFLAPRAPRGWPGRSSSPVPMDAADVEAAAVLVAAAEGEVGGGGEQQRRTKQQEHEQQEHQQRARRRTDAAAPEILLP